MSEEFTPTPYQPDLFVDREDEQTLIQAKIEQACRGAPIERPIVYFHSIPRGGKTWLLRHLAHRYASGATMLCGDKHIIVASIDCSSYAMSPDWQTVLVQACKKPFLARADVWRQELDRVGGMSDLSQVIQRIVNGYVVLFLFDALDALSTLQFAWLDETLLEPLACSQGAVVVLAGLADVARWRIETARRLHIVGLRGFNADETAQLGRMRGFAGAGQELYRYSQGHPYLAQLLASSPASLKPDALCEVLQHVEDELLRDCPADKRRMIRLLAILRRLERDPLRALLQEMWWEGQAERTEALWLLRFFQEHVANTDWLDYDLPTKSYHLTPVVRGVLLQQLRLADPALYARGHRVAGRLYRKWLKLYPLDSGRFLREAIYHHTAMEPVPAAQVENANGGLFALIEGCLTSGCLSADQVITLERDLTTDQSLPEQEGWIWYYERVRQALRDVAARTGLDDARPQEGSKWNN